MSNSVDDFFARLIRHSARNHHDFVAALHKFGRERKPNFFHAAAHRRRHGKKSSQHDCDFHWVTGGSFRTCKSESTAFWISKRRSKQLRALARIRSRTDCGAPIQRFKSRTVPEKSSDST